MRTDEFWAVAEKDENVVVCDEWCDLWVYNLAEGTWTKLTPPSTQIQGRAERCVANEGCGTPSKAGAIVLGTYLYVGHSTCNPDAAEYKFPKGTIHALFEGAPNNKPVTGMRCISSGADVGLRTVTRDDHILVRLYPKPIYPVCALITEGR